MRTAAATAAPLEMPERIPSSRVRRRAYSIELLVGDLLDLIHQREIKDIRHESGADPLNLVRTGLQRLTFLALREHGARRRLNGDRDDRLPLSALDVARHSGDGPAGAHPRYEDVDGAFSVVPDFRAGCLLVNGGICRILRTAEEERNDSGQRPRSPRFSPRLRSCP